MTVFEHAEAFLPPVGHVLRAGSPTTKVRFERAWPSRFQDGFDQATDESERGEVTSSSGRARDLVPEASIRKLELLSESFSEPRQRFRDK